MGAGLFWVVFCCITLSTAFAIIFPGVFANQNAVQIDENGSLDSNKDYWHKMNVWIWVMCTTPLAIMPMLPVFLVLKAMYFLAFSWMVIYAIWSRSVYWLLFDRRLNRVMNRPDDYLGENSKVDLHFKDAKDIIKKKLYLVAVTTFVYLVITGIFIVSFSGS